jgi:H+-transporting ATPase
MPAVLHPSQEYSRIRSDELIQTLGTNIETGLSSAAADLRMRQDGPNEIPQKKQSKVLLFLSKFCGLSSWMIELIAILALFLHNYVDFFIISALLCVNAVLSYIQELRASVALELLSKKLSLTARVLRDGQWQSIPARFLVKGDIIRIRTGDFAPADVRLLDGFARVDQSMLTGEAAAVEKYRDDALFSGSTVLTGEATGVVTATGTATFFGRTSQLLQTAKPKPHVIAVRLRVKKNVQNLRRLCYKIFVQTVAYQGDFEHGSS